MSENSKTIRHNFLTAQGDIFKLLILRQQQPNDISFTSTGDKKKSVKPSLEKLKTQIYRYIGVSVEKIK